jgi:GTPase
VLCATATSGDGVDGVWRAVSDHRAHLVASGGLAERRHHRASEEVTRLVAAALLERARAMTTSPEAAALADEVAAGDLDPWTAADRLLGDA